MAKNRLYLNDIFVWHPGMVTPFVTVLKKLENRGHSVSEGDLRQKCMENGCLALIDKNGKKTFCIVNYDVKFSSGEYKGDVLELDLSFKKHEDNIEKHKQLMKEIVEKKIKLKTEEGKSWFWSAMGY